MNKSLLLVVAVFCMSGGRQPDAIFRHVANVIGATDDRAMVKDIGKEMGLSLAEVNQIRGNVGYVACPGKPGGNPASVTGFLMAPDVVVTVAHLFYDENGARREPWEDCYYQSMGDRPTRYAILKRSIRIGTSRPHKNINQDFATFRLVKPVRDAQPFLIPDAGSSLDINTEILPISAYRETKYMKNESRHEPLGQACHVRKIFPSQGSSLSAFYSDCDNTFGGSGGPNLVRASKGLTVVGIFVGAADPKQNFKPYYDRWMTPEEEAQFSVAVSIFLEGRLVEMIQSLSEQKSSGKGSSSYLNID